MLLKRAKLVTVQMPAKDLSHCCKLPLRLKLARCTNCCVVICVREQQAAGQRKMGKIEALDIDS